MISWKWKLKQSDSVIIDFAWDSLIKNKNEGHFHMPIIRLLFYKLLHCVFIFGLGFNLESSVTPRGTIFNSVGIR